MNVSEAVASRRSVRAFLDRPVDGVLLRRLLEQAARAPSGGNLQPWHLHAVGGEEMLRLKAIMRERLAGGAQETPEYFVYPQQLGEPYRRYRYELGEALYAELGIAREDRAGRLKQFARNFQFFDAPLAVFCSVDRQMGPPQWSDLGMYLQTLMLLLREAGLDSCPQECWSAYPKTIAEFLQLPAERMLFCAVAIGYADEQAPVNRLRSARAPLADFAEFRGI
ncbi:Nitroreductase [Solimonas aquatica]|uniref:Nitroreductase n=1 Tax=Solimonas aquatica TaxID=489703 RepID=A0A1H9EZD6_9GAMM|nr:nitroreductase [Solimonas aquatica]SEQ31090.1 Nitroreductase [Solimonas aquatica]